MGFRAKFIVKATHEGGEVTKHRYPDHMGETIRGAVFGVWGRLEKMDIECRDVKSTFASEQEWLQFLIANVEVLDEPNLMDIASFLNPVYSRIRFKCSYSNSM